MTRPATPVPQHPPTMVAIPVEAANLRPPRPPVDEHAARGRALLVAHRIDHGDEVEVELLLTVGPPATNSLAPRLVEGRVADATAAALVLEDRRGRQTRIPWAAVALIRDAVPTATRPHPALD